MGKVVKYSLVIVLVIALIVGGIFFYLYKDGYQVVFNSNGGSVVAPVQTRLGTSVDKPDDPVRAGYQFVGWYLGDEKFDFDTIIEENITLTAHWEEEVQVMHVISFDTLGGNDISSVEVEDGEVLLNAPTPIKSGYTFAHWYYHNQEFDFSTPIFSDMVLVAKYEKVAEEKSVVTISFDSNGGSSVEDVTVEIGELAKMPKAPTKEGYTFAGWYLDGEEFSFLEPVYEDLILDAYWVKE